MHSVVELQDFLRQILNQELGNFASGRKAIAVEPPTAPKSGTGLHVFVSRYSDRLSNLAHQYRVTLTQFDKSEEGLQRLDRAIAIMRQNFPCRQEISPPYQEDMYAQKIFLLMAYQSFHTSPSIPIGRNYDS